MNAAERNELLAAIDECAAQARHLADAYDLPGLLVAATKLLILWRVYEPL